MRNLEVLKCNFANGNEFNLYTAYLNDGKAPKKWELRLRCVDNDEALGGGMEDYSKMVRLSGVAHGWHE